MGTELRPLSVACNIQCHYCYQNPQRDAAGNGYRYDMQAMKAAVEREGKPFTLFGGEPLLVPERDLAELWSWGLLKFGRNGIQTNGSLINERHIMMFKRYRVSVGISIDGPGASNDARWVRSLEATRRATAQTEAAISQLCKEKVYPSVIVTLHRENATEDKLPGLVEWLRALETMGVRSVRLHILEVDSLTVRQRLALTEEENIKAFLYFAEAESSFKSLKFDVFEDIRRLLTGKDNSTTCIWNACDQYTTTAVRGVEGSGQRSNCGRTNKDGIDYVKSDTPGYERYIALSATPYEHGGCKGCRFFIMCKGQCPGTAISGDWRNRSEHCRIWMRLFEYFEQRLQAQGEEPLSMSALRLNLEEGLLALWASGKNSSLHDLLCRIRSPNSIRILAPTKNQGSSSRQPEFIRTVWVSDRAAAEWTEKVKAIAGTWRRLEWRTVYKRAREAALLWISASEIEPLRAVFREINLDVSVLQVRRHHRPNGTDVIGLRVAVGASGALRKFRAAWARRDSDALGELLGYPTCCRATFARAYLRAYHDDSTWQIASTCAKPSGESEALEVKAEPRVNILLARAGVQLIPHLPCSFACEKSVELAETFQSAADSEEETQAISNALEMLSWPMEWSATNGIAEIKTPIIKLSYRTDRVSEKRLFRYLGKRYPDAGAAGIRFPFSSSVRPTLVNRQPW